MVGNTQLKQITNHKIKFPIRISDFGIWNLKSEILCILLLFYLYTGVSGNVFEQFLSIFPPTKEIKAHEELAKMYFSSGNYTAAIQEFNLLLNKRLPKMTRIECLSKKGLALEIIGNYEGALEAFKECITREKKNPKHHLNLTRIYEKTKLNSQAIAEYKKVLKLVGDSVAWRDDKFCAYYGLGRIYHSQGLNSDAIYNFTQALMIKSTAELYRYLSACYEKLHNFELSASMLKQSLAFEQNTDDYLHLAFLYTLNKKYSDAIDTLRVAVDKAPQRRDIKFHLSAAYFKNSDFASARNLLKVLSDISPNDPLAHFLTGFVHYFEKNYELAYRELLDAQRLATTPMIKDYSTFFVEHLKKKLKNVQVSR
ncbi:MAG: tetratricopeptide repeat protein [Elusimicrobiota bacterium]|nr:tetratricopeptide repeat protein [Elusimicrobiota bacterium]